MMLGHGIDHQGGRPSHAARTVGRRILARENLIANLQDRTVPLLPHLRVSGRGVSEGARHRATTDSVEGDPATLGRELCLTASQQSTLNQPRNRRGHRHRLLGSKAGYLSYEELLPRKDSPDRGVVATPGGDRKFRKHATEPDPGSRASPQPTSDGLPMNSTPFNPHGSTMVSRCEGRLDYAQMPVTISELHNIMTGGDKRYHRLNALPAAGGIGQTEDSTKDPHPKEHKKTNIRISIKRDNKGKTPAVTLTMKVTLPNISHRPSTSSTLVAARHPGGLLRCLGNSQGRRLAIRSAPPDNMSVTYPDDCYTDSVSSQAPPILRQLDETRVTSGERTRRWLAENPVGARNLEPPTSSPLEVRTTHQRRVVKLRIKAKTDDSATPVGGQPRAPPSGAMIGGPVSQLQPIGIKVSKRIRITSNERCQRDTSTGKSMAFENLKGID